MKTERHFTTEAQRGAEMKDGSKYLQAAEHNVFDSPTGMVFRLDLIFGDDRYGITSKIYPTAYHLALTRDMPSDAVAAALRKLADTIHLPEDGEESLHGRVVEIGDVGPLGRKPGMLVQCKREDLKRLGPNLAFENVEIRKAIGLDDDVVTQSGTMPG